MCDSSIKQTQILPDSETLPNGLEMAEEKQEENVWGRLFPIGAQFKQIELKKDKTTFGRRSDCDVHFTNIESSICAESAYSNLHFTIKREFTGKTGAHALIEDTSSNGTFINGEKIGKGRIQALKSNAEIALCKKENKSYIFIDLSNNDEKNYPLEIRQKYTITKQLGVGAYGEVRLAFDKNTGAKFAIKIIQKKKFTMNGRHQINTNNQIASEISILKKLKHPCIIGIHEVIDTFDTVFIVLDLVEGGELFDKVVSLGRYDEPTAKLLFYQMVSAIKYLHDQGISHRDLKPENILLCSDNNATLIKITDFGLSKFFDAASMMKTFCGTPNYLAPEVLVSNGEGKYTNKIDNWSLGVILYICLVGFPPFGEENLDKQIREGIYDFLDPAWSSVSSLAIDVIKKLMQVDPDKRASLEQILEHDWIRNDTQMLARAQELMFNEHPGVGAAKRCLETSSSNDSNSSRKIDYMDTTTASCGNKRFKFLKLSDSSE